mmetsp:Transcript_42740/g.51318  ORF Transcript_42740/g.51318 Transcript_42740/m.51318 type:complete len:571 (+) Transcript_42740:237-1949(+)
MVYQTERTNRATRGYCSANGLLISIPLIFLVSLLGLSMPVPTNPTRTVPEKYSIKRAAMQNRRSQKQSTLLSGGNNNDKSSLKTSPYETDTLHVTEDESLTKSDRHHYPADINDLVISFKCIGDNLTNDSLLGDELTKSRWEKVTVQYIEDFWNNHLVEGISFVKKVNLSHITIEEVTVETTNGEDGGSDSYLTVDDRVAPVKNHLRKMKFAERSLVTIQFSCHGLSYDLIDFAYKKFGIAVSDMDILQDPFSGEDSRQFYLDSLTLSKTPDMSRTQNYFFMSITEVSQLTKFQPGNEVHQNSSSDDEYVGEVMFYVVTGVLYIIIAVLAMHLILKYSCKNDKQTNRPNARVSNDTSGVVVPSNLNKSLQQIKSDPNMGSRIDVYAPPGNLGIVIEFAQDDGYPEDSEQSPPMVHSVRDDSPLAKRLQHGDVILAVDDEIVTGHGIYTILAAKKKQSRKFTIWRAKEGSVVTSTHSRRSSKSKGSFKKRKSSRKISPFENESPTALPTTISALTRSVDDILSRLEDGNVGSIMVENDNLTANEAKVMNDGPDVISNDSPQIGLLTRTNTI